MRNAPKAKKLYFWTRGFTRVEMFFYNFNRFSYKWIFGRKSWYSKFRHKKYWPFNNNNRVTCSVELLEILWLRWQVFKFKAYFVSRSLYSPCFVFGGICRNRRLWLQQLCFLGIFGPSFVLKFEISTSHFRKRAAAAKARSCCCRAPRYWIHSCCSPHRVTTLGLSLVLAFYEVFKAAFEAECC